MTFPFSQMEAQSRTCWHLKCHILMCLIKQTPSNKMFLWLYLGCQNDRIEDCRMTVYPRIPAFPHHWFNTKPIYTYVVIYTHCVKEITFHQSTCSYNTKHEFRQTSNELSGTECYFCNFFFCYFFYIRNSIMYQY